ncbi:hypothetical protein [Umezawaea beigongshangensis]|uniref:hypothetical protein n=1 Tax=Umezawaea beigongshangensis TaxID=2780383 RepID=UPI0018F11C19|nr:hypothetical protein [Umezawaea beigongshangensis]
MRSITRMIIGGTLSIPLALAAAGMASADTAHSHGDPYSIYVQEATAAGPEGASTYFVYSEAGYGHHHHHGHDDCKDDCHEYEEPTCEEESTCEEEPTCEEESTCEEEPTCESDYDDCDDDDDDDDDYGHHGDYGDDGNVVQNFLVGNLF